jgi:hypothetical protein
MGLRADQRIFERLDREISGHMNNGHGSEAKKVLIKNISANGASLLARHQFTLGEKLSLSFDRPSSSHALGIEGDVVWSSVHDSNFWKAGVRFKETNLMRASRILSIDQ